MNKITEKYTSTIDTAFILGNPLGEENPALMKFVLILTILIFFLKLVTMNR
jgi:hypothetical protein